MFRPNPTQRLKAYRVVEVEVVCHSKSGGWQVYESHSSFWVSDERFRREYHLVQPSRWTKFLRWWQAYFSRRSR